MRRAAFVTMALAGIALHSIPQARAGDGILRLGPLRVRSVALRGGVLQNDNILGSTASEKRAFDNGDLSAFFVVKSLDDRAFEGRIETELATPSFFHTTLRWKIAAEGTRYVENAIRSSALVSADLRQKLPAGLVLDMGVDHAPQNYARHRRDKDALTGAPAFRAEVYRETGYEGQLSKTLGARFTPSLSATYGEKDYRPAFDERDQWRRGAGAGLGVVLAPGATFDAGYEFARCRSRNDPALSGDLSYRESVVSAKLRAGLPARIHAVLSVKEKYRRYTSGDATDLNRYRRHDRIGSLALTLDRRVAGRVGTYLSYSRADRRARVPAPAVNIDDEGSYTNNIVAAGLTLTFD